MISPDLLWKAILEDFFEEAVALFLPELYRQVNWRRGFKVLDKELQQLLPESEMNHKRVDFLAEVILLDNTRKWLLVHIEVQGYKERSFSKRIYTYYYRLKDRFDKPIVTLVLLTDTNKNWYPSCYEIDEFGTKLRFEYNVFKLLDWSEADFQNHKNNVWAIILKIAKIGLKSKWQDKALFKTKLGLYLELRDLGLNKEQMRRVFRFLRTFVPFREPELIHNFDTEILKIENKQPSTMGIDQLFEQHFTQIGEQRGILIGEQRGIQIGEQRGIQIGEQRGILIGERLTLAVLKLHSKGFEEEAIAAQLKMSVEKVKEIKQLAQSDDDSLISIF